MNSEVQVLQPTGTLDGITTNDLRRQINDCLAENVKIILIDFQRVNFMNSAGLGALIAMFKDVRARGAKLFLCSLNEQVKIIFSLTKVDRIFQIYESREAFEQEITQI